MPAGMRLKGKLCVFGRLDPEEAVQLSFKDLAALSCLLGELRFFHGDKPSSLDCVVFGHLAQFLYIDMEFPQAEYLRSHCNCNGRTFVRYDPTCIGQSEGSVEEVQFKDWVEDAAKMLVEQCAGPTVLVGSSMGGWISLLLASRAETRELVKGLVLVAPALNFFRPHYHQMASELPVEQQVKLEKGETVAVEDEYGVTYLRKSFADASAELELDLSKPLDISVPCRILHGARDATIPYRNSVELMEKLVGSNVELIVRKEAEHRFSENKSLEILTKSLEDVISDI